MVPKTDHRKKVFLSDADLFLLTIPTETRRKWEKVRENICTDSKETV